MISTNNIDQYCRPLEDHAMNADVDEDSQLSSEVQDNMRALLKPVDVSQHPEAIKKLGPYIYIHTYIYTIIYYIYIYIIWPDPRHYLYIYIYIYIPWP